jgi:hypothetical protein
MIAMTLAAATAAAAADQGIDAKVSGKIEGADAKVSGTITINIAPATQKKAAEQDQVQKLAYCGKEWNKNLEKYNEERRIGQRPDWLWLTRLDYRSCMDKCLAGNVVTPAECKVDPLPQKSAPPNG